MGNFSSRHNTDTREEFDYNQENKELETRVYCFAIILWIVVAIILGLITSDIFLFALVLIPVIIFASYVFNKGCYYSSINSTITGEFLYIILTIFLAWVLVSSPERTQLVRILFVSLGLYILSLFDIKLCNPIVYDASIIIFETMSTTLILVVVYLYFKESFKGSLSPSPSPIGL